jgi:hypothetical protein
MNDASSLPESDPTEPEAIALPDDTEDIQPVVPVALSAPQPSVVTAEVTDVEVSDETEIAVQAIDELTHLPALPDEPIDLPTVANSHHGKEKAAAIVMAVIVHAALALLLGVLIVVVPGPPSSEITAISAPAVQEQAPTSKKIAEPPPQSQVTQMTASMKFTTATNTSAVPMPAVEFDPSATTLDLGSTMGTFDTNFGSAGAGSIMMFGKKIDNVRKIAVVMDVSRSMTRYLPEVVKELKKVGRDSALVLYFGCWMNPLKDLEPVHRVGDEKFDKFWQYWQGKGDMQKVGAEYEQLKYNPKEPMPLEDVYKQVAKRKDTYFIDRLVALGARSSSVHSALLAKEIKDADVVYWFADFQDRVDEETAADVVKKFKQRNRKLYIHAPHDKGPSLTKVAENMVKPLKGEVTILDIK